MRADQLFCTNVWHMSKDWLHLWQLWRSVIIEASQRWNNWLSTNAVSWLDKMMQGCRLWLNLNWLGGSSLIQLTFYKNKHVKLMWVSTKCKSGFKYHSSPCIQHAAQHITTLLHHCIACCEIQNWIKTSLAKCNGFKVAFHINCKQAFQKQVIASCLLDNLGKKKINIIKELEF